MSDKPYYVLVCGGRTFDDRDMAFEALNWVRKTQVPNDRRMAVVHGGATGADGLAQKFANTKKLPCFCIPAEWDRFGRSAGPRRNSQMLSWLPIDLVVTFPGGAGTLDMKKKALLSKIRVYDFRQFDEPPAAAHWETFKVDLRGGDTPVVVPQPVLAEDEL